MVSLRALSRCYEIGLDHMFSGFLQSRLIGQEEKNASPDRSLALGDGWQIKSGRTTLRLILP
jgi:hypothetical protein